MLFGVFILIKTILKLVGISRKLLDNNYNFYYDRFIKEFTLYMCGVRKLKSKYKICIYIIISLLSLFFMPNTVSADLGPKPSVELHIENPPDGLYYVDFLVSCDEPHNIDDFSYELGQPDYNKKMLKTLIDFYEDGYCARLRGDSGVDFGVVKSNAEHIYDFIYMVPEEFKIIIVTENSQGIVSPLINPKVYNTVITFNAASGTAEESKAVIAEDLAKSVGQTLVLFVITCSLTILTEWIVFRCFKIEVRKMYNRYNSRLFRLTNVATQIFLYIMLEISGSLFIPAEILIFIAEACIFELKMKETGKANIMICTFIANAISYFISIPFTYVLLYIKAY